MFDKVVIITKKTPLEELVLKFNSKAQARFYIEHSGYSFDDYLAEDETYRESLEAVSNIIPKEIKCQYIERDFLPNFLFGDKDLIITMGTDGLVINTAKYLNNQPIIAINPDPRRIDGIMTPFVLENFEQGLKKAIEGEFKSKRITMAEARLNDGQVLYGVNDLFIGVDSHISFKYRLGFMGQEEDQSSSGIIVTTGAGSTAWFRAIIAGARGICRSFYSLENIEEGDYKFDWESRHLYFSIREPFESKTSSVNVIFGRINEMETLNIRSYMASKGVIFSDGIENDFIKFNSGKVASVGVSGKSANLVIL